jgi:hypothetical protein
MENATRERIEVSKLIYHGAEQRLSWGEAERIAARVVEYYQKLDEEVYLKWQTQAATTSESS